MINATQKIQYFYLTPKEMLLLLFLWILLYFEPINIGMIKISQLWKSLYVIFLFLIIITWRLPIWFLIGFIFSIKYIIYVYFPYGLIRSIGEMLEELIFPLLLLFLVKKYRNLKDYQYSLLRLSVIMSVFFIYSSVPFLMGLDSLNPLTDLSRWGLDSDSPIKGLFYHIAVSSQVYCTATLIILCCCHIFKNTIYAKLFCIVTVILGAYLVFGSFARTGWFIFILGLFLILTYGNKIKYKLVGLLLFTIIISGIYWTYQQNEAMQLRLKGGAVKYRENVELSFNSLMQARWPFVLVAIENLQEEGIAAIMLGYGQQHGMDLFERKTGMPIVSHNRTMEILESSGFLGLSLYLLFMLMLYLKIWRNNELNYELKKLTLLSGYLFIMFFMSHGMPLWSQIIVSPIFAASIINKEKIYLIREQRLVQK